MQTERTSRKDVDTVRGRGQPQGRSGDSENKQNPDNSSSSANSEEERGLSAGVLQRSRGEERRRPPGGQRGALEQKDVVQSPSCNLLAMNYSQPHALGQSPPLRVQLVQKG